MVSEFTLKLCVLFRISTRFCVDFDSMWTGSDMKMAKQLREISASNASPSEEIIAEVLCGTYGADEKPVKEKGEKVTIPKATYTRYLGSYSKKEANLIIEKALVYYFENKEGGMAAC